MGRVTTLLEQAVQYTVKIRSDYSESKQQRARKMLDSFTEHQRHVLCILITETTMTVAKDWVEDRGFPRILAGMFSISAGHRTPVVQY